MAPAHQEHDGSGQSDQLGEMLMGLKAAFTANPVSSRTEDAINELARKTNQMAAPAPVPKLGIQYRGSLDVSDVPGGGSPDEKFERKQRDKQWNLFHGAFNAPDPTKFTFRQIGPVPPGFNPSSGLKLYDYQRDGAGKMLRLYNMRQPGLAGCCLADEIGLGKTIQTIAFLTSADLQGPALLVVPGHILEQWSNEFHRFLLPGYLDVFQYHGDNRFEGKGKNKTHIHADTLSAKDVVLTTYDQMRNEARAQEQYEKLRYTAQLSDAGENVMACYRPSPKTPELPGHWPLLSIRWSVCILDEGHKIRDPTKPTSQSACKIEAEFRICITGTRLQNRFSDIGGILLFLRIEPWCDHWLYKKHFVDSFPFEGFRFTKAEKDEYQELVDLIRVRILSQSLTGITVRREKTTVFEGKTILPLSPVKRKTMPGLALDNTKPIDRKWWLIDVPPEKVFSWEDKVHTEADTQDIVRHILDRKFNNDDLTKEMADWERTQPIFYASAARCHPAAPYGRYDQMEPILNIHPDAEEEILKDCTKPWMRGRRKWFNEQMSIGDNSNSSAIYVLVHVVKLRLEKRPPGCRNKILVFAGSLVVLDIAAIALQKHGVSAARFDGTVPKDKRKIIMENLADIVEDVLLVTTQSGALGCNWTAADTVFQLQRDWNPYLEDQALCRAYRHGQKYPVHYYQLFVEHSIDVRILALQKIKRTKAEYFLSNLKQTDRQGWEALRSMSRDTFEEELGLVSAEPSIGNEARKHRREAIKKAKAGQFG